MPKLVINLCDDNVTFETSHCAFAVIPSSYIMSDSLARLRQLPDAANPLLPSSPDDEVPSF